MMWAALGVSHGCPTLGWVSGRSMPFWNLDADKDRQLVPKVGLEGINDLAYCEGLWSEFSYSNVY